MQRGHRVVRKARPEPQGAAEPDLSTTSRARAALERSARSAKPEDHAELQKRVAERYPDMLQERRRSP